MAEKVRNGIRSFLKIEPAQQNGIFIQETYDFETNAAKNRIWYRGDTSELSQFYKSTSCDKTLFWAAVPTPQIAILKRHTGLPGIIIDTLTSIVISDMNKIEVQTRMADWEQIANDNNFMELVEEAVTETLCVGDGAFKITIDTDISQYPLIEFVPGDNIDIVYRRGRVAEVVFKTQYEYAHQTYILEETYGKGCIIPRLFERGREVPLNTVPELAGLAPITFDKSFMMAVPFKVFKSARWKGRGRSIFDSKDNCFDALDEVWSQWMDALRKGRSKEYIPSNLLIRDEKTGEVLKPNPFDNAFIALEGDMEEGKSLKIDLQQADIPHESYLSTYVTALELCLQGIISPSTIGIDVKKLDNAEAQREKEKTTLYTRNKIVAALQKTTPMAVNTALKAYDTLNKQSVSDCKVDVPFGEYANPSFESQVETVSKAKTGGVMSTEAAVDELYGSTKDDNWKTQEVARIKAEQGIAVMDEPAANREMMTIALNEG